MNWTPVLAIVLLICAGWSAQRLGRAIFLEDGEEGRSNVLRFGTNLAICLIGLGLAAVL